MISRAIKRGRPKGFPETGGRKKGVLNSVPTEMKAALKEAIIEAAQNVGDKSRAGGGLVAYLEMLAASNTSAFASLLGKVLPYQVEGPGKHGALVIEIVRFGEARAEPAGREPFKGGLRSAGALADDLVQCQERKSKRRLHLPNSIYS